MDLTLVLEVEVLVEKTWPYLSKFHCLIYVPWWLLFLLPSLIQALPFYWPHGTNMPIARGVLATILQ